jgi:hypothetical protein
MRRAITNIVATCRRKILDFLLRLLESLNNQIHPASVFNSSLVMATVLCVAFDLYQACTSGPVAFWVASAITAVFGMISLLKKWGLPIPLRDSTATAISAYYIAVPFIALALVFSMFPHLGVDHGAYALNGLMAFVFAVLPWGTAIVCRVLAQPLSCFFARLERMVASCATR